MMRKLDENYTFITSSYIILNLLQNYTKKSQKKNMTNDIDLSAIILG